MLRFFTVVLVANGVIGEAAGKGGKAGKGSKAESEPKVAFHQMCCPSASGGLLLAYPSGDLFTDWAALLGQAHSKDCSHWFGLGNSRTNNRSAMADLSMDWAFGRSTNGRRKDVSHDFDPCVSIKLRFTSKTHPRKTIDFITPPFIDKLGAMRKLDVEIGSGLETHTFDNEISYRTFDHSHAFRRGRKLLTQVHSNLVTREMIGNEDLRRFLEFATNLRAPRQAEAKFLVFEDQLDLLMTKDKLLAISIPEKLEALKRLTIRSEAESIIEVPPEPVVKKSKQASSRQNTSLGESEADDAAPQAPQVADEPPTKSRRPRLTRGVAVGGIGETDSSAKIDSDVTMVSEIWKNRLGRIIRNRSGSSRPGRHTGSLGRDDILSKRSFSLQRDDSIDSTDVVRPMILPAEELRPRSMRRNGSGMRSSFFSRGLSLTGRSASTTTIAKKGPNISPLPGSEFGAIGSLHASKAHTAQKVIANARLRPNSARAASKRQASRKSDPVDLSWLLDSEADQMVKAITEKPSPSLEAGDTMMARRYGGSVTQQGMVAFLLVESLYKITHGSYRKALTEAVFHEIQTRGNAVLKICADEIQLRSTAPDATDVEWVAENLNFTGTKNRSAKFSYEELNNVIEKDDENCTLFIVLGLDAINYRDQKRRKMDIIFGILEWSMISGKQFEFNESGRVLNRLDLWDFFNEEADTLGDLMDKVAKRIVSSGQLNLRIPPPPKKVDSHYSRIMEKVFPPSVSEDRESDNENL